MLSRIRELTESVILLVSRPRIRFDENLRGQLPVTCGVYRITELNSDWRQTLYVGRTTNLQQRLYHDLWQGNEQTHSLNRTLLRGGLENREAVVQYLRTRCAIQFLEIRDERACCWLEHFAIATLRPKWNDPE